MLNDIFKSIGPIIASAMAGKFDRGEFRFDNGKFHFGGDWEGVPLEDLDLTQPAPEKILVLGPAAVRITQGDTFRIRAEGEGARSLRFSTRDDKLVIARRDAGEDGATTAMVDLTLPAPRSLAVMGSGSLEAGSLAGEAKISVAGSGSIRLEGIDCERLRVNLMGSGHLQATGKVAKLKLVSAGSGVSDLAGLEAGKARLSTTGSGSIRLASDGEVEAKMMGSGNITIFGRARCQVQSMGSGKFNCIPRDERDDEGGAPVPPAPPKPPKPGSDAAKPRKAAKTKKSAKAAKRTAKTRKTSEENAK
jgi:endonuclease YncB( thermonuclease family)